MILEEILKKAKKIKLPEGVFFYETLARVVFNKERNKWEDEAIVDTNVTTKYYEINCTECKKLLLVLALSEGDKYKKYEFIYTNQLMAYRPRPDYIVGLECKCGNDTRLSDSKNDKLNRIRYKERVLRRFKNVEVAEAMIQKATQTKEKSHWNTKDSKFKLKEVK